jgi:hypothetical protein
MVEIDHLYGNSTIMTECYGMGIYARYAIVSNLELVDQNITFSPNTSVHAKTFYDNAKLIKVDSFSFIRNKSYIIIPIIFSGISNDLGFDEIYLNNICLPDSAIYILSFKGVGNSKAGKIVICKLRILTVNLRNGVLIVKNHSISYLDIKDSSY